MATIKRIGKNTYHINQVTLFKKLHLDRQLIKILGPMFKGLESNLKDLTTLKDLKNLAQLHLDLGALIDGVMEGISALTEEEYEKFINTLLAPIQVQIAGSPDIHDFASDPGLMEVLFGDDMLSLYGLMIAALQENKLSPFELVARGLETSKINISGENPSEEKKHGNE